MPLNDQNNTQAEARRLRAFDWLLNNLAGLAGIGPGKKPGATGAPGIHTRD
jgi:hypothetical protein